VKITVRTVALATALAVPLSLGSACFHPRFIGNAIVAAAIIGTVAVLAHHDAHYHDEYCGHQRRYHDGRWVYYYGGHWEYHDPHAGRWYYYEE
jgi:hypothetical protein